MLGLAEARPILLTGCLLRGGLTLTTTGLPWDRRADDDFAERASAWLGGIDQLTRCFVSVHLLCFP
jgi:hypothetical protein